VYSLTFPVRVMLPQQMPNPPNSAHPGDLLPVPKLHPGPCNSVGMRLRRERQTDRRAWQLSLYISRRLRLTQNVITQSGRHFSASADTVGVRVD